MGLIYPKKCVLCEKELPLFDNGVRMICSKCAGEIRRDYRQSGGMQIKGLDGAAAPFYYRGSVAASLKRFKFNGRNQYALWYAAQMAATLAALLPQWKPDLITFVPIGFWRLHCRGYNQSELLATAVAKELDLPCQPLLRKNWFIRKQSLQNSESGRWDNAKNAFKPWSAEKLPEQSRVVLVDDIITTGATVSAAGAVLREMGAHYVYALAAATTKKKR